MAAKTPWRSAEVCRDYGKLSNYNDKIVLMCPAPAVPSSDESFRPAPCFEHPTAAEPAEPQLCFGNPCAALLGAFSQIRSNAQRASPRPATSRMSHRLLRIFSLVPAFIIINKT